MADKIYSLWATFTQKDREKLQQLTRDWPCQSGHMNTPYPHITLGSLADLKQFKKIPSSYPTQQVTLKKIGGKTSFYQSLFIEVDKTKAFMSWRAGILNYLNSVDRAHYFPHISLYYGHSDVHSKWQLGAGIGQQIPQSIAIDCIQLRLIEGATDQWPVIEQLHLRA